MQHNGVNPCYLCSSSPLVLPSLGRARLNWTLVFMCFPLRFMPFFFVPALSPHALLSSSFFLREFNRAGRSSSPPDIDVLLSSPVASSHRLHHAVSSAPPPCIALRLPPQPAAALARMSVAFVPGIAWVGDGEFSSSWSACGNASAVATAGEIDSALLDAKLLCLRATRSVLCVA